MGALIGALISAAPALISLFNGGGSSNGGSLNQLFNDPSVIGAMRDMIQQQDMDVSGATQLKSKIYGLAQYLLPEYHHQTFTIDTGGGPRITDTGLPRQALPTALPTPTPPPIMPTVAPPPATTTPDDGTLVHLGPRSMPFQTMGQTMGQNAPTYADLMTLLSRTGGAMNG